MITNTKKEQHDMYPLGFLSDMKKPALFCSDKKHPEKILLLANYQDSPIHFSSKTQKEIILNHSAVPRFALEHVRHIVSAKAGRHSVITFVYKTPKEKKLFIADHKAGHMWWVRGPVSTIMERGGILPEYTKAGNHVLYYGESSIWAATSKDLKTWIKSKTPIFKSRPGFFDHGNLRHIASHVTEKGILILYDASVKHDADMKLQVGAVLVSASDPHKVIWRADTALFEKHIAYDADFECVGSLFFDESISIYWYTKKEGMISCSIPMPFMKMISVKALKKVQRHKQNPIISPKRDSWWRSAATLNPAAVNIDGTIHLLFRAMGDDGISRIGYAWTKDGFHIDEIDPEPIFALKYSQFGLRPVQNKYYDTVMHASGGSWGGCEDPRMVKIGKRIYLTFNMFDNWDNLRVGMVSISVADFLDKKWNWSEMQFISPKVRYKNFVLFPEKIHGKYAIFHNLHAGESDRVLVRYINDIDAVSPDDLDFESVDPQITPNRKIAWHLRMRAPGASPLKTSEGWLLFYHAHDAEFSRYKIGALLLDLDDPTKIIARSSMPILTPDMWYENDWKPGIVYMCGAVIKDDTVFLYYGGGDKYVCVATVPLAALLESLKADRKIVPIINKVIIS